MGQLQNKLSIKAYVKGQEKIFTDPAIEFLELLCKNYALKLEKLLDNRKKNQDSIDAGFLPSFRDDTKHIREAKWQIQNIPDDLKDRRVEITGPVERSMIINALNADAKVFMADFEDSLAPSFTKIVQGHINLIDAVNRNIDFISENNKEYKLKEKHAVLIARVRGLHLVEKHILFNDKVVPASLIDFGLYFFHNHEKLISKGSGPYFYIPKLESYLEARWWAEVFSFSENHFNLKKGTIKCTCLIETLPAVFEMDEILYELSPNIVGLNCGRWDYIFSYIKTLKEHSDRILPDRQVIKMEQPFLAAYSKLLIKTCHKRGAFAMGGMAAFIPNKNPNDNIKVLEQVRKDKELEANNGHDGTWIAHPGLASIANEVFDEKLKNKTNQLEILLENEPPITASDLLTPCEGDRTENGIRINIRIALQYIESWIRGNGCVPIYGLMEDAATAEISRALIWQWIKHEQKLTNGKLVTKSLFKELLHEECENVKQEISIERYESGRFEEASKLLEELSTSDQFIEFLTIPGYELLTS